MSNMLRKGIKVCIQRVYFPQSYFEYTRYGKRFNSIKKIQIVNISITRDIFSHIRGRNDYSVLAPAQVSGLAAYKGYHIVRHLDYLIQCAFYQLDLVRS